MSYIPEKALCYSRGGVFRFAEKSCAKEGCWFLYSEKMDSQGRKVVVCDNGTGVSLLTDRLLSSNYEGSGFCAVQFDR